jgi:hypothetical protein
MNADLAIGLEATNAWTMSGARIDHHERAPVTVGLDAGRWLDTHQAVIHRSFQVSSVCDQFDLIVKNVGDGLRHVLTILLAAPAHDVEEQDAALAGVHQVFKGGCEKTRQGLPCICQLFHRDFSFLEPARHTMLAAASGPLI